MSNVASLELCKELYELSGWSDVDQTWIEYNNVKTAMNTEWADADEAADWLCPAYDLGYLLRKLPVGRTVIGTFKGRWYAQHVGYRPSENKVEYGDSPEDAAVTLAIELLKSGILTSEHETAKPGASPK